MREGHRQKRTGRGRESERLRFYQERVPAAGKQRKEIAGNSVRGQMENCLNLDFNGYRITLILAMINFSAR
jgi:hypothetical protein